MTEVETMRRAFKSPEKRIILILTLTLLAGCFSFKNSFFRARDITASTQFPILSSSNIVRTPESVEQEKHLLFDDPSGISILPDMFSSECDLRITLTKTNESFPGNLIVYDHEAHVPLLWEPGRPQDFLTDTLDLPASELKALAWSPSPTHEWLSFEDVNRMNDFSVNVYDLETKFKYSTEIREFTQAGYPLSYWADPDHYVVPLLREGRFFKWLVWQPFKGEQSIIKAELPGIGDAPEQTAIFPMSLPDSGMIIHPCNQCGENEYQAYELESKRVIWTLDFSEGRETGLHWSFVASPDGKRIVFYFGLNKLWVIGSMGEDLVKVSLPFAKNDNWVAKAIRWSPAGDQLAFIRDTPDGSDPVLTIVSILENQQTSYCSNLGDGNIHWSFDGRYIVHSTQERNNDGEIISSTFSIIHLETGKTYQARFPQNLSIIGWLK
jgi:hypothetical protein